MKMKSKKNDKPKIWVRLVGIMGCTLVLTLGVTSMIEAVSLWQHFKPHLAPCLLNQCVQPSFWKEYWYFGLDVFCTILSLLASLDIGKAIFCEKATDTQPKL